MKVLVKEFFTGALAVLVVCAAIALALMLISPGAHAQELAGGPESAGLFTAALSLACGIASRVLGSQWMSSGLVYVLVQLAKREETGALFSKLSPRWSRVFVLLTSLAAVGVPQIISGAGAGAALGAMLQSGAGAMFLHELRDGLFRKPVSMPPITEPTPGQRVGNA